jgi:outer membrane immunogenic protein
LAVGDVETGQDFGGGSFSQSETSVGWTAGGGVDYALTDQFVVGAQYRYYDFGSETFDNLPGGFADRDQDVDLHTLSLKAGYKF